MEPAGYIDFSKLQDEAKLQKLHKKTNLSFLEEFYVTERVCVRGVDMIVTHPVYKDMLDICCVYRILQKTGIYTCSGGTFTLKKYISFLPHKG